MTTRSPIRWLLTSSPTAMTVPVPSWPTIQGKSTSRPPDQTARSEPQTPTPVSATTTSPRPGSGSGQSASIAISPTRVRTAAFISPPSRRPRRVLPRGSSSPGCLGGHANERVPRSVARVTGLAVDDLEQHASLARGDVAVAHRPPGGILVVQDVAAAVGLERDSVEPEPGGEVLVIVAGHRQHGKPLGGDRAGRRR